MSGNKIFNLISYQDVDFVYVWTCWYPLELSLMTAAEGCPASRGRSPRPGPPLGPPASEISRLRGRNENRQR